MADLPPAVSRANFELDCNPERGMLEWIDEIYVRPSRLPIFPDEGRLPVRRPSGAPPCPGDGLRPIHDHNGRADRHQLVDPDPWWGECWGRYLSSHTSSIRQPL
jgi:hypothetical protein